MRRLRRPGLVFPALDCEPEDDVSNGRAFSNRKRKAFLFYLVCDVSRSMWDPAYSDSSLTPYEVIADALTDLVEALDDDEQVRDIGRLSMIAFADDAQQVVPLTPLRQIKAIPALPQGTETDYAAVFEALDRIIRSDVAETLQDYEPYRPVVYFITDGDPQKGSQRQDREEWMAARRRLSDPTFDFRPSIVALGLGQVQPETLRSVATTAPPGVACVVESGQAVGDVLRAMLRSIVVSVTSSSQSGELVFPTPTGMRRL